MVSYIILLLLITLVNICDINKRRGLLISCFILALFCSLKSYNVGSDTMSYKIMYESFGSVSISDLSNVYWTEIGFNLIEYISFNYLKLSFRVFLICIYIFVFYSYYKFIKNYSLNYVISLITYICFSFLTFDLSALRNTIAIAICLFSIPFAYKKGIKNLMKAFLIVAIAALFHKSAYIFILAILIIKIPVNNKTLLFYIILPIMILIFKKQIFIFINNNIKHVNIDSNIYFGGKLIFYIAIFIFSLYIIVLNNNNKYFRNGIVLNKSSEDEKALRIFYSGIVLITFSSSSILARLAQYELFFLIIVLPNAIEKIDYKQKKLLKILVYIFMIIFFILFDLKNNLLNIVPYEFFWRV